MNQKKIHRTNMIPKHSKSRPLVFLSLNMYENDRYKSRDIKICHVHTRGLFKSSLIDKLGVFFVYSVHIFLASDN